MIIKCDIVDKRMIDDYIGREYFKCLYLYLDFHQFGTESNIVDVYIQKDNDSVTSISLKYHSALHIYSQKLDFDIDELVGHIRQICPSIICAERVCIEKLAPALSKDGYESEFGHIGKMVNFDPSDTDVEIKKACLDDIDSIAELLYSDDDIGASYSLNDLKQQIYERLSTGFVRSYVIKDGERVVCHAGTGAEVVGVSTFAYLVTDKDYRGKGFGTKITSYTCRELKKDGLEIFSVYYPENSRRLHHKLGFEDVCEFGKLYLNIN